MLYPHAEKAREVLKKAAVVPVITINHLAEAVPLARALIAGGIPVLEVTLRTAAALEAIRLIRAEVPDAIVGAGTVLSLEDLKKAVDAGSEFIITPGITDSLLEAGVNCGVPFIPGIATVSELMRCRDKGLRTLKFFPAEANGGAAALKAFAGPFADMTFCPTGGIGPANIAAYLSLPSVLSVGGSWIVPNKQIAAGEWEDITRLASESVRLVSEMRGAQD